MRPVSLKAPFPTASNRLQGAGRINRKGHTRVSHPTSIHIPLCTGYIQPDPGVSKGLKSPSCHTAATVQTKALVHATMEQRKDYAEGCGNAGDPSTCRPSSSSLSMICFLALQGKGGTGLACMQKSSPLFKPWEPTSPTSHTVI